MLWRFLLAVAAISCTLLRTHAHGPKDRIKDLMCVLLLSGMQKEDLDVSLLNKLQRYNVNIHDTNNEDLLQECVELRRKSNGDIVNKTLNASGFSDGILQNIRESENSPQTQSNPAQNDKEIQTDNIKIQIKNDTIKYFDGKPKLDSVLKFWQDMKLKKDTMETPKNNKNNLKTNRNFFSEPIKKRNVQENSDSNEEDDIKKLLESYFLKKHNNIKHSNKETSTTTTTRSIDNIYKQSSDNKNDQFEINRNDKRPMRLLPIEVMRPFYTNYSEMLGTLKTLNTNSQDNNKYFKDTKIPADNHYFRYYKVTDRPLGTTEKDNQQQITYDMIQAIAKSVKEIVLRDLKLHITDTSTSKTSTTTTKITKIIPQSQTDSSLKIQESVMNRFLEMFQEIKTLKQNSIQITSNNINKENIEQTVPVQNIMKMDSLKPNNIYNNPYKVQYKSNTQNLNFLPQIHKFRANEVQVTVKTAPNPFVPIMFQTNNLEIPPLGIPIDKPLNPINQNIIVTSAAPYRIGVIKNNLKPRNNPFSELEKFDEHVPKQNVMSKSHEFNAPTSYDVRFTSNKAPKHHQSYYDKIRLSNYRPRSDNVEYIKPEVPRFHERIENIDFLDVPDQKRYTDRIDCCNEKYAYSKQMVECCDRKIASRQQMSLNSMKKSYDDTHFKNFLKTQQKVTDMLERILGTRDTVRSVETT